MIPGINLLNIALTCIQPQSVRWFKFLGNTTNALGQDIPSFDAGTDIVGSFQPVEARIVKEMGFDTQKSYRSMPTSNPLESLRREASPDYVTFMGRKYQVCGEKDWYAQDGWRRLFFVDIGAA